MKISKIKEINKKFDKEIVYPINRNPKAELSDHSGYIYFGIENKTVKKIKSFYRQQILSLIEELEGKLNKLKPNRNDCLASEWDGWKRGHYKAKREMRASIKSFLK